MTTAQSRHLHALLRDLTIVARDEKLRALSYLTRREITTSSNLTDEEFAEVKAKLAEIRVMQKDERVSRVDDLTRPAEDPWAQDKPAA